MPNAVPPIPVPPLSGVDLARLVQASPDVLFQISPDARWSYVSPAWTAILGYPVERTLGRPLGDHVVPADRAAVVAAVERALRRGGSVVTQRARWHAADGRQPWLDLQCRRIDDDRGRLLGAVGTLRDVTAAARDAEALRREHALNAAILDTARAPIVLLDEAGRIVRFNRACEHVSGYTAAEVIGRDVIDLLVPEEDRPAVEDALRAVVAQGSSHHESRWTHRDGSSRLLLWSNTVLEESDGDRLVVAIGTNITRQRAVEEALRDSERRLREVADLLTEGVYVVDAEDRVTFLNPAAVSLLGWTVAEVENQASHALWHHHRPDGTAYAVEDCPVHRCLDEGTVVRRHEDWFIARDGQWLPVALTAAPIIRGGGVTGAVVAFHDISERLAAQARLRQSEIRYRTLFDGGSDAIFVISLDAGGRPDSIIEVNRVACERLGYSRDDLCGKSVMDITDPTSVGDRDATARRLMETGEASFECVHLARDGRRYSVEVNGRLIDYDGQMALIAIARDITERKEAEERIRYLADFDQLTGLPNRAQVTRRCGEELSRAQRHGHRLALLFLDLDGFKAVNDTHGHATGDELLKVVAHRLANSLRASDIAARQGGDEFVILLPEVGSDEAVERVADKLIAAVNRPVEVGGLSLHVGVSVGLAVSPRDGTTVDDLQRHADTAMYAAKAAGRNRWARFRETMESAGSGDCGLS
jgi:diguanylate cyclase (GGDEF)-like protein/PAS domain S-box-containing protein